MALLKQILEGVIRKEHNSYIYFIWKNRQAKSCSQFIFQHWSGLAARVDPDTGGQRIWSNNSLVATCMAVPVKKSVTGGFLDCEEP